MLDLFLKLVDRYFATSDFSFLRENNKETMTKLNKPVLSVQHPEKATHWLSDILTDR